MIKKIENIIPEPKYIYTGSFDISEEGKLIVLDSDENISIDMNMAVNSTKETVQKLTIEEVQLICRLDRIKAIFYPNGNVGFRKLDSSNDELTSCYLSITETQGKEYLVCISFDETQPTLYKAELLSIYSVNFS